MPLRRRPTGVLLLFALAALLLPLGSERDVWAEGKVYEGAIRLILTYKLYGYLALWQNGALTFRVRRPPRIADAANPLRGLTITVDPGHPPGGETGPSTYY